MTEERRATSYELVTITVTETVAGTLSDLDTAAEESGLHRDLIRDICLAGYVRPYVVMGTDDYYFDDKALYILRKVHELNELKGVNMRGVRIILDLRERLDVVENELRSLRERIP